MIVLFCRTKVGGCSSSSDLRILLYVTAAILVIAVIYVIIQLIRS